jgi:hypothetical protein
MLSTLGVLFLTLLFLKPTLPQTPKSEPLCLNSCNRRGECSSATATCTCQEGYLGPDCSKRTCPFGPPWSGRQSNLGSSPLFSPRDKLVECSNSGVCDRVQGRCVCFPGFGGQACERTRCMPFSSSGGNCTGHGQCMSMSDIHKLNAGFGNTGDGSALMPLGGAASGDAVYRQWDSERIYGCVCDRGFSGPDCRLALCPAGDSPRTRFQQRRVVRMYAQVPAATNPSSLRFKFWFAGQQSGSIDMSSLNTENCPSRILNGITTINASASSCRVVVGGRLDVVRNITIGGSRTSVVDSDGDLATGSFEAVLAISFSTSVGGLSQQTNLFPFSGSPPISLFGCFVDSAYSTAELRASVSCRVEDVPVTSLSIVPAGTVRIPSGVSYNVAIHDPDTFPNKAVVTKIVAGDPELITTFPPILLTTRPQGIQVATNERLFISFGSLWGHTKDATWKITSPNDVDSSVPVPPSSVLGLIKTPTIREHDPCSGQGLCDEETGLCQCFTGSSGVACEVLASISSTSSSEVPENDPALVVEATPTNFAGVVLQISSARPLSADYNFIECADKGRDPSFVVDGLGRVETTGLDVSGATYLRRSLLVHMSEPLAKTFNDKVGVLSVHYGSSTRSPGPAAPVLAVSSEFPRTGGYFNSTISLRFDEFGNPVPFTDPAAYSVFRVSAREFVDSYGAGATAAGVPAETSLLDVRGDGIVTSRYGLRVSTGGVSVYSGGVGISDGLYVASGTTSLMGGFRVKGDDLVINGTLFASSKGFFNDLFVVGSSSANSLKGKVGLVTDSILVAGGITSLLGEVELEKGLHVSAGGIDVTRGGITVDYGGLSVYAGGAVIGTGSMSVLGGGLYAANDADSPSVNVKLARNDGGVSSGTAGAFAVESSIQSNNPRYVAMLADNGGAGGNPNEPFATLDPAFYFSRLQNLVTFITVGKAPVRLTSLEIFVAANVSDLFSITATLFDVMNADPTIDDETVKLVPVPSGPAFPSANASAFGSVAISNQTVFEQELSHVELVFRSGFFPLLTANKTYAIRFSAKSETGDKSPNFLYAASAARSETYINAVRTIAGDYGITITNLTAITRKLAANLSVLDPQVAILQAQDASESVAQSLITNLRANYTGWTPAYNFSDYNKQIFTLALAVLGGPPSDPPLPGYVANTGYAGDVVAIAGPLASQSGLYNVLALRAGAVDGTDGGKALLVSRDMDIQSSDTFVLTTKDVITSTMPSGDISLVVGSSFGVGGKIALNGGIGYERGGDAILRAGNGLVTNGGNAFVYGGQGGLAGGNVLIQPGKATGGNNGNVYINDAEGIPRMTVNGNGDINFSPTSGSITSLAAANPIVTYATFLSLVAKTTVVVKGDNAVGGLSPGSVIIQGGDAIGPSGGSISIRPGINTQSGGTQGFVEFATANAAGANTKRLRLGPIASSGVISGGLKVFADDGSDSLAIEYGADALSSSMNIAGSLSVAGSVRMLSGASISGGGLTVGPSALFNGPTSVQGGLFTANTVLVTGSTSLKGSLFTDGSISINARGAGADPVAAYFQGPINVLGSGIVSLTTLQASGDIVSKTGDLLLETGKATFNGGISVLDKFVVSSGGASFLSLTEPTIFNAGVSIGGSTSLQGDVFIDNDAELLIAGQVSISNRIASNSLLTVRGDGILLPSSSDIVLEGGQVYVKGTTGGVSIGMGGLLTSGGISVMGVSRFDKSIYFGATVTSEKALTVNTGDLTVLDGNFWLDRNANINGGVSIGGSLSVLGDIITTGSVSLTSTADVTLSNKGLTGSPHVVLKGEDVGSTSYLNGGSVSLVGGEGGLDGGSVVLRGGAKSSTGDPGTILLQDSTGYNHVEVSKDGALVTQALSLAPSASLLNGGKMITDGTSRFKDTIDVDGLANFAGGVKVSGGSVSLTGLLDVAGTLNAGIFGAQMVTFCFESDWSIGGKCYNLVSADPGGIATKTVKLYFNGDTINPRSVTYSGSSVVIPSGSLFPIYFL